MEQRKKRRARILNLLKVAISLGGAALVLSRADLGQVLQLLKEMNWLLFLAALLLFLSGSLVRAYRWGALVWSLGVAVSWGRLVALYFVGAFFSLFLPTGVGGDAVRMYELSREDGRAAPAISSVLVDRFFGLFVLLAMALLAVLGSPGLVQREVRILIAVLFVASLVAVALILQRTWIEAWGRRLGLGRLLGRIRILRELYDSLHLYSKAALLRAAAASVVWNVILIVGYYLLGQAVGIGLSLRYYLLFVPVISVLLMVPSIGGLGIREGGTVLLFSQAGVNEHQALALALAYDLTLLVTGLIGAVIYTVQSMREARQ